MLMTTKSSTSTSPKQLKTPDSTVFPEPSFYAGGFNSPRTLNGDILATLPMGIVWLHERTLTS